jgi:FtsP/CotA-like multicopper oxidase with cupredoxin domain
MTKHRLRVVLACLATLAIVVPLGWMWQASLMPDSYSVMDMGEHDLGGGAALMAAGGHDGHGAHEDPGGAGAGAGAGALSVEDLTVDSERPADVTVDLVADRQRFTLASGREVDGFTLNGSSPGETITAKQGDLVEVRLRNGSVPDGVTLHWHGLDVPNAEDGVAGVTQDAVDVGEEHVYRFVAEDAGTYWYHSHQVSHEQVLGGLLGPIVIRPREPQRADVDAVALTHSYNGTRTVNGFEGDVPIPAEPGDTARVRVINTDNATTPVTPGATYRVLAVDGFDLNDPTPVTGTSIKLAAGGRVDLEVTVPDDGSAARIAIGTSAVLVGPEGATAPPVEESDEPLDLLSYGSPASVGFDPAEATRTFDYDIGRRPGFLDGRPGLWWTINGKMFPDVPMFMVREGDVVVMRIHNGTDEVHPMHLHGHHAVVLSRDGEEATGSPWWVDSLDVLPDESYEIAFLADNPGVWMDHCHNLPHAVEGLVAHLMYDGVTTPFRVGDADGNEPE